eukprot:jgi/Mesvir1/5727/Mv03794-RA.1
MLLRNIAGGGPSSSPAHAAEEYDAAALTDLYARAAASREADRKSTSYYAQPVATTAARDTYTYTPYSSSVAAAKSTPTIDYWTKQIAKDKSSGGSYAFEAKNEIPASWLAKSEWTPRSTAWPATASKGVGTLTEALAALRADPPPVTAEASAKFAKTLEKAGFPSTRPELRTGSWFSSSNAYMANCSQGLAKKMTKSEAVELASYLHPTIPKDLLHGATKPNLCAMVSDEIVTAVTTALTEAALRDTSSHARLFNIARLTNPKIPATDIAKMTLEELREVVATSLAPSDRERIVSAFGSLQDAVTHGTVGTFNLLKLAADKARAMRASHSAPVLGQAQEAAKEAVKASTAAVGTQTAAPAPSHIIGAASFAANRPRSDAARKIIATYHLDRASKFSKFLRSTAPGSAVCKPRVRTLPCGGADRRRGVALCG